jgi:hypothetical protein
MISLQSCLISINSSGYKLLSEKDKSYFIRTAPDRSICNLPPVEKVYFIHGKQLKDCISGQDSSLVYLWAPRCSSSNCLLLSACQDICRLKGYSFYVVAEYIDVPIMKAQNSKDFPMFAINPFYYNTESTGNLRKLFLSDLLDKPYSYKEYGYGRYMIFHSGRLVRVAENITTDL